MGILREPFRYCEACGNPEGSAFIKERAITIKRLVRDNDHGFVVTEADRIVFSFAGSDDFLDWISNFNFLPLEQGNTIHNGFYDAWKRFKDEVTVIASDYAAKWLDRGIKPSVLVVGHSRGAALATLCARHLAKNLGLACRLVAYGSPRLGTEKYRQEFELLPVDATRVENGWDLVCDLPPDELGYKHVGKLVAIKQPIWHRLGWFRISDHLDYPKALEKNKL